MADAKHTTNIIGILKFPTTGFQSTVTCCEAYSVSLVPIAPTDPIKARIELNSMASVIGNLFSNWTGVTPGRVGCEIPVLSMMARVNGGQDGMEYVAKVPYGQTGEESAKIFATWIKESLTTSAKESNGVFEFATS